MKDIVIKRIKEKHDHTVDLLEMKLLLAKNSNHTELIEEIEEQLEEFQIIQIALDNLVWKPIEEFDGSMFSIMTDGTPDRTEVIKYKGFIPDWAKYYKPLIMVSMESEEK